MRVNGEWLNWLSRRISHWLMIASVVVLGLALHGMDVSRLGLYWDDTGQFLQGLYAADGHPVRFILSDTFGFLRSERPFAHFPLMIQRAAFVISLPALHWSLVGLLVFNAALLMRLASEILNEGWFVFAVGVTFLSYPCSPLQVVWPATAHYLWASLFTLLAVWCFLLGLRDTERKQSRYFILAAILYLTSMLTHEAFALIPFAFVSSYLSYKDERQGGSLSHLSWLSLRRPVVKCLALFLITLAVYACWRLMILPMYARPIYLTSEIVLSPGILVKKFLMSIKTVAGIINMVSPSISQVLKATPDLLHIMVSIMFFGFVWMVTFYCVRHPSVGKRSSLIVGVGRSENGRRLQVVILGAAIVLSSLIAVGISPFSVSTVFGASHLSRVNFIMLMGIALLLPISLVFLVQLGCRYTTVTCLMVLCFLLYIGFIDFPANGNILSYQSLHPTVFGRFSTAFAYVVIAYIFAMMCVISIIVLSFLSKTYKVARSSRNYKLGSVPSLIPAHFISGILASLVFLGSLFHISVKKEFVGEWNRQKMMLGQLQSMAPMLADNTFVVTVQNPPRPWFAPYTTHYEHTAFLIVLYNNWSLMGNRDRRLRFYADGVESIYGGKVANGFPPGVKGPIITHAKTPIPRISYDRLLLLEFDGHSLRMIPELEAVTEEGTRLMVYNHPERILTRVPGRSPVWSHVANE